MTNKMPVVGQRYRNKEHRTIITVMSRKEGWITTKGFCKIQLSDFWKWFEELPEDNLQETEEVQEDEIACHTTYVGYNNKAIFSDSEVLNAIKIKKNPNPVDLENGEANEIDKALASLENKRHYNKGWDDGFNFAFDCIEKAVNNLNVETTA